MQALILHPTDVSQWHTLINEAQAHTKLILTEDTESYLVFLLMRFTKHPELIESVIALDFLHALHLKGQYQQVEQLQEIGDKSLLFCSIFPGMAEKRKVQIHYFSHLGQTAYLTASCHMEHPQAPLFEKLGEQFTTLQQVLQAMTETVKC